MHILHVTLGFLPAISWGGPVKIVHQNCKELVNRGYQVTIYCTNLLNKKQKIKPGTFEQNIDGIRVVYMDAVNLRWWPGTLGPIWLPDLSSYLKREINSFDIVHLNGYRSPVMLSAARAARFAGVPIVTQPHGTLPIKISSFFLKRAYDQFFGKMELDGIRCIITLQDSERLQAIAHGVPENRIEVMPNGIDTHERDNLPAKGCFRQRYKITPDAPVILFVGRINKIKGTDMLIEAFSLMNDPTAHLVIVGPDDGQYKEVVSLIKSHGLSNSVTITGLVSDEEKKAAFIDSDIYVLPSRSDAFPTTIMESCLMGIPMVITDRCEIASILKHKVAEVVPFDAQAFANAMRSLLTDKERYKNYKSNTQAMVADTFSIKAVVDRLESIYQHVTAAEEYR